MTSLHLLPESPAEPGDGADRSGALPGAGLLTCERGHLPLVAMTVVADITGLLAAMTIRQVFANPHGCPIEATYIFPLPDRAAVTDLTVTIGDRRLAGAIEERQAARDAYGAALASGRRSALLEEDRPDVFTIQVGNLAPGEEATVELSLAGPVAWEYEEATFRVPLVVAPRYIPGNPLEGCSAGDGTALDTQAVPDASRITPPVLLCGGPNPVKLEVTVRLDPAGMAVSDLRSSLHAAIVACDPGGVVTVELQPGERLNRDFILRYRVDGGAEGQMSALAIPDAGSGGDSEGDSDDVAGTYVVTILPPAHATAAPPRDVVLLLDRSGSMGGWKMVAARRAAARIVDSLTSADRFAIIAFDDSLERPPGLANDGLVEASDRNRYRAVEWLGRLDARGGTELAAGLAAAYAAHQGEAGRRLGETAGWAIGGEVGDRARARCCILVTDGQVGDEDRLVRLATDAGVRMFTVGVDQAVNAGLLHRLAAATGGRCELAESEDRLDGVLSDLQRRLGEPVAESVTVRFDALAIDPATMTPARPADLYPGVPLVMSGRFRGRAGGRATVSVADGSTISCDVVVTASRAAAAVWARGRLRDLEDLYAAGGGDHTTLASQIVAVSRRHRVLCRFTAWVAVDHSAERVEIAGPMHRIVQPVELPGGWAAMAATAVPPAMEMYGAAAPVPGGQNVATPPPVPFQPHPVPGSPPPMRMAIPDPAPSRRLLRAPRRAQPATPPMPLPPWRVRLDALLAEIEGLDSGAAPDERLRQAGEARRVARELASEVPGSALVGLIEALADALIADSDEGRHAALRRLRKALREDYRPPTPPRSERFWR